MKTYYVTLRNMTDRRDDEIMKVKANTPQEAREKALMGNANRFFIGSVISTKPEFDKKKIKEILKMWREGMSYSHLAWSWETTAYFIKKVITENKNKKEFKIKKKIKK